jgi:DNA-binding beta-propeller fold protein YncE
MRLSGSIRRRSTFPAVVWLGVAVLILFSQPSAGAKSKKAEPDQTAIVWPAPPETARIAYVQSVMRPSDLGIKRSAIGRVVNWITGADKGDETLVKPFALGLDESDNLCLTDTGSRSVSFYDRQARKWHQWRKIGKIAFSSPVAVDKVGNTIYVADSALGMIIGFDVKGRLLFATTNHLDRPSGLVVRGSQILVADSHRHAISRFDLAGQFVGEFGRRGTGAGEFNFPTHLALDATNHLWVTDSMNGRVQVFDEQGNFKKQIGSIGGGFGQFSRPKGIGLDPAGRLYVVDAMFDNIQIFNPQGQLLLPIGGGGTGPGQFWLPNGIVINSRNEIFVADSYNRRLQVFRYVGPQ